MKNLVGFVDRDNLDSFVKAYFDAKKPKVSEEVQTEKPIQKWVVVKRCIETEVEIPVSNPHFSEATAESIAKNCNRWADMGYEYLVRPF